MRRKDILIISAILIVVAFCIVLGLYCFINSDTIYGKVQDEITEVAQNKKAYHSNGWETAIVDKIIHNVPVPVGFTYAEGDKKTGIIIQNDETQEKYMWIPMGEISEIEYAKIATNTNLDESTVQTKENMEKYEGFYVAIGDTNLEENIEIDEKTKLDNYKKTSIIETHTLTVEELALINKYKEQIGDKISLKNFKTLTLASSSGDDYPKSLKGVRQMLKDCKGRIEDAKEYIEENTNYDVSEVEDKIEIYYDKLLGFDGNNASTYDDIKGLYSKIKNLLVNEFDLTDEQQKELLNILDGENEEKENTDEENKEEEPIDEEDKEKEDSDEKNEGKVTIDEKIVTKITDKNGDILYVPQGFDYEKDQTVQKGFKITNGENLSFIWIPVEDVSKVKENFKTNGKKAEFKEDLLLLYENYTDDTDDTEYDNLKASITLYGGFYISEAEMGYDANGHSINKYREFDSQRGYVSDGDYYRNVSEVNIEKDSEGNLTLFGEKQDEFNKKGGVTYENAKEICEELYSDSSVVNSHLTYGLEYDATVNYLIESGAIREEEAFINSTNIGKYWTDDEAKRATLWVKKDIKGIYGLAGNLAEITQEADKEGNRVYRGGSWNSDGISSPLASRNIEIEIERINTEYIVGEDKFNIEDDTGFRACLYIKTEYKENEDLEKNKETAKNDLKNHIDGISIRYKVNEKSEEKEYFNNNKKSGTEEYELEVLNSIVKYVNGEIDKQTSSAALDRIVQYGKDEVDRLADNIKYMITYGDIEGYTTPDVEIEIDGKKVNILDKIKEIKETAIADMEKLAWSKGILKDSEGKEPGYSDIRVPAEEDIEDVRNIYRNQFISTEKSDKEYINILNERKNNEIKSSNDLANFEAINTWYNEIQKVAEEFDKVDAKGAEDIKKDYLNKIANAYGKDEAEAFAKEGKDKIAAAKPTPAPTTKPSTTTTTTTTTTNPTQTTKPTTSSSGKRGELEKEISTIWKENTKENTVAKHVLSKVKDDALNKFSWIKDSTITNNGQLVAFKINGKRFVQMVIDWTASKDSYDWGEKFPYFVSYDTFAASKGGGVAAREAAKGYATSYFKGVYSDLPGLEDYSTTVTLKNGSISEWSSARMNCVAFWNARIDDGIHSVLKPTKYIEYVKLSDSNVKLAKFIINDNREYKWQKDDSDDGKIHNFRIVLYVGEIK